MKIDVKFMLGELVFFMRNNEICSNKIDKIEIYISEDTVIKYVCLGVFIAYERELFKSKQDLLDSL